MDTDTPQIDGGGTKRKDPPGRLRKGNLLGGIRTGYLLPRDQLAGGAGGYGGLPGPGGLLGGLPG
ncbi:hypothetical protein GCM10027280_36180 [Micromonospora polyrhachis]